MGVSGARFAVLAAMLVALAIAGSAAAQETSGASTRTRATASSRSCARQGGGDRAAARGRTYGIDFNDHYLRTNADGSVTVTVFGDRGGARGAATRPATSSARRSRAPTPGASAPSPTGRPTCRPRSRPRRRRSADDRPASHAGEIVVLRVDYFENYAGRFLSVEAKDGTARRHGRLHRADAVALLQHRPGTPIDSAPAHDERQHRSGHDAGHLHRAPRARAHRRRRTARRRRAPTMIRIGSSTGAFVEAGADLARRRPAADEPNFLKDFTTRYMDPTEVYARFARARGGVPGHRRDDHAAEQDERLPAEGAGHDGGPDGSGNTRLNGAPRSRRPSCSRRARGATRAATTSRPSS